MPQTQNPVKKLLKGIVLSVPYIRKLNQIKVDSGYPPGHYYSPIPDLQEIQQDEERIFGEKDLKGIDLNTAEQLSLLEELKRYYPEYPYAEGKTPPFSPRYKKEGAFYRYSDSFFLFSMLRHFKPKRVIEVGSGHSSAIMLDTNEHFLDNQTQITLIEPNPGDRLDEVLKPADKAADHLSIIVDRVQAVPASVFQQLQAGDILFIDSTHVSKIGSDLNYLMFEVLPILNEGVIIHFHDIFYPFQMPKDWVYNFRFFWNENYMLQAFLMNNTKYKILAFNTYLQKIKHSLFEQEMPECLIGDDETGSIWLQKMG